MESKEGGTEGGSDVEVDGGGEREKTLKSQACSQPKERGEEELGLLPSHLRGLRRPVGHGDGHLVLGVTGIEKPALLLCPIALRPPPQRRQSPVPHSLAGLLAHAEAGLSLGHTHL